MTSRRQLMGALAAFAPLPALLGCQAAPDAGADRPVVYTAPGGVGCIFLNAPITPQTRELMSQAMYGLINVGATTIRLAINSPGGETDSARAIVAEMDRIKAAQRVTFETYAVGLVASAATYVYLNGQRRFARNGSGFLFHAAGLVSTGAVSAERLREEAAKIDSYEMAVRALLKARTRLNDSAIDVYLHRTVILNADDAVRDGVVDSIYAFSVPPNGRLITIGTRRVPSPTGGAPAQPGSNNGGR